MKRIFIILIFLFSNAVAFAQGFTVKNYTANIDINAEGYFDVVENYDIEFTEAKHGIFREIITEYDLQTFTGKSEKRSLVIKNLEVPGQTFSTNSGPEQRFNGSLKIKIGDKNELVTGIQHYEIKYRVYNAFLFEDSIIQFYWNIKPQGWEAEFQQINFYIHVPQGISLSSENCFVYSGNAGTTTPSEEYDYTYTDGLYSAKSKELAISLPGQNVTVLIKLPKNSIRENFITIPLWQQYGWIGILVLLLIIFWRVWVKYGKDDRVIATTSYYPPKGIDPAMAGYLIDDKGDTNDLISFLPHWASQGFITIEEIPKSGWFGKADMKLKKIKSLPDTSPSYEKTMFNGIFSNSVNEVLVSSLENIFYMTMNAAKKQMREIANENYYETKSNLVMKITIGLAVVFGVLLCILFLYTFGPIAAVLSAITSVFIASMSFYLQKKNSKGNSILSELKGFKQFIKIAEINRIKMLLEEDPKYFEKTMSYALAFGLLDKWADKFDTLNLPPPNWYTSNGVGLMNMHTFSQSFSGNIANASSNMVSSPSSSSGGSGGGSSGGGFGGGGGGSW
jgi:uncharacterized membrane protein